MSPQIFVSCVSKEFKSARMVVSQRLNGKSFIPVTQEIFGTEAGDLRKVIREKIDRCVGLVQIVGVAYGAEPPKPDSNLGPISYTQYEFHYARSKGKKIWIFEADEGFPRDHALELLDLPADPAHEDPIQFQQERFARQQDYVEFLRGTGFIRHGVNSFESLELKIEQMHDELKAVRRSHERWKRSMLATSLGLFVLTSGTFAYSYHRGQQEKELGLKRDDDLAKLKEESKRDLLTLQLNQQLALPPGLAGKNMVLPGIFATYLDQLHKAGESAVVDVLGAIRSFDSNPPDSNEIHRISKKCKHPDEASFLALMVFGGFAANKQRFELAHDYFKLAAECELADGTKVSESHAGFPMAFYELLGFYQGPALMENSDPAKAATVFGEAAVIASAKTSSRSLTSLDQRQWRLLEQYARLEQAKALLAADNNLAFIETVEKALSDLRGLSIKTPHDGYIHYLISIGHHYLAECYRSQKNLQSEYKNLTAEHEQLTVAINASADPQVRIAWKIARAKSKLRILGFEKRKVDANIAEWKSLTESLSARISDLESTANLNADLGWKAPFQQFAETGRKNKNRVVSELVESLRKLRADNKSIEEDITTIPSTAMQQKEAAPLLLEIKSFGDSVNLSQIQMDSLSKDWNLLEGRMEKLISVQEPITQQGLQLADIDVALRHLDIPNITGAKACMKALKEVSAKPGDGQVLEKKLANELVTLIDALFKAEANLAIAYADEKKKSVRAAELRQRADEYEIPNSFGTRRMDAARQCREEASTLETNAELEVNRRSEAMIQAVERTAELLRVHHAAGNDEVTVAMSGLTYAIVSRTAPNLKFDFPVSKEWVEEKKAERSKGQPPNP